MKPNTNINSTLLAGAITCLSGLSAANAATLVNWNFGSITTAGQGQTEVTPVTDVNSGILLPSAQSGAIAGVSTTDLVGGGTLAYGTSNQATGEINVQRFDGSSGDTTVASDGVPDGWVQFTLSSAALNTLTVESISVSQWRNGAGAPPNIGFQISLNGGVLFTDYAAYQTDPNSGDFDFDTFIFTNTIPVVDDVIIRFAPVGGPTTQGQGNLHINGLTVTGTVPEPASALLGGLGALGLLMRRRRS